MARRLALNWKSCKHPERQGCNDKDVDNFKSWYEISKYKSVKVQERKANGWQNKMGRNWVRQQDSKEV